MCWVQELGSYAQGQGHNQVRGQIVPKIVLLINFKANLMILHRKIKVRSCVENKIKVPMPKVKVTIRSEVKIVFQQ